MSRVRCYVLEVTEEQRVISRYCEDCKADHESRYPLYRDTRTGALVTLDEAGPGAMYRMAHGAVRSQDDGAPLNVILPNRHHWCIDSRAGNCDRMGDYEHHCWVREGEPPDVTAGKSGNTCGAGAGSILSGDYHGFLRGGYLEEC